MSGARKHPARTREFLRCAQEDDAGNLQCRDNILETGRLLKRKAGV